MAFLTGEVVPIPDGSMRWKVVFKTGGSVAAEWPVESLKDGEEQIIAVLSDLRRKAEEEGYL